MELVGEEPGRAAFSFRSRGASDVLQRGELGQVVAEHAAAMVEAGVAVGDRVVIAWPRATDFVPAFWATQVLGAVAVPAPSPRGGRAGAVEQRRLASIIDASDPSAVSCPHEVWDHLSRGTQLRLPPLAERVAGAVAIEGLAVQAPPRSAALIQFTSGSTGRPKGCVLTHEAIITNLVQIAQRLEIDHPMWGVNWCPLFHDMGLVGSVILPVWSKHLAVAQLSVEDFVRSPLTWLRLMHEHRAEISAAPNFAFALVAKRLRRNPPVDLDLSCVRSVFCGAEPIHAPSVRAFLEVVEPLGFSPAAIHPAYGLAEHVVLVSSRPAGPHTERIDRFRLSPGSVVEPLGEDDERDALEVTSLGTAVAGCEIRVVGGNDEPIGDRQVGEIELRSPSLMAGYFRDDAATTSVLSDGWLRTGDLGYLANRELHLVGRSKDVVIVGGRNIFAHDVEHAVMDVDGVRLGGASAFGITTDDGPESLVIVVEARAAAAADVRRAVRRRCLDAIGITPHSVVVVAPGDLPRTSSGKIQRSEVKAKFLSESSLDGRRVR